MRACATVFALLSADARGRAKFVESKSALVSLFDLLRSKDQGTKVICGKVCEIFFAVSLAAPSLYPRSYCQCTTIL